RICTKLRGNEMLLFFLFMLMNMVVTTSAFDCGSSVKGVKIIGCYKRSPKVFDHLLVESFLNEDMMCECAIKAQENGDIAFAVSDYQACLATKDQAGYAKILKDNTPVTHTYDCINNYFEDCRPGQQCFGNNYYEYIYELPKKQTETTTTQAPIKTTATPTQINGGWGEWTKPTPCSKSCGGGKTTRSRKCDNPAPAHGGKDCEGSDTETRECNTFECPKKPVNGGWGEWTKPTPCSKSCGGGTTTRSRKCDNPAPANGGWNCEGSGTETQKCNTNECPKQAVNGGWGEWTKPTLCSKSCGGGKTTRSRKCDNPAPAHGEKDCEGSDTETRECNAKQCAVDGGFGEWSGFGECSVTCGVGTKTRRRECDQPKPSGGGKTCQGETTQTENCDTQVNCPVDGKWAEWSEWESCDKCCGGGSQRRYRTCDNPPPGPNGKKCQGERIDSRKCNIDPCRDQDCFFKYTPFTPIDKDGKPIFLDHHQIKCPASHVLNYIRLQKNEQETMISYGYRCCKTQACANLPKTNDETYNGGGYGKVFNLDHQTVACKSDGLSSLKLDRDMTRWNYKYDCCKLGNKNAELDCYNANSQFLSDMGGSVLSLLNQEISCKCDDYYITDFKMNRNYNGNENQIRYDFQCCKITSAPCNTKECQVVGNGNWGELTYWSDCSATCGNGVHKRTRKCDNPPAVGGGKDCEGEAVETKPCNTGRKCPVDGKWAEWSGWESCDKCCGGGSQRRYRTCDNPPPGPNGKKCQGERIDLRKCNTHSCPDPKNCFFKYTQYTPLDKDGKPIFLDQHQIKCPASHVLNYIRLQKNEQETMISYGYRCCKTQACANLPKTNDETYNGGGYGKVFNLDHQTVACKNEGLSSLKLDRDMTRWNYKYDCCKLGNQKAELDCYNANSQFLSNMGGSVLSLLNQEISCKCDDYYITDFKMNRNYNGNEDQIRYDFQCCKITSAPCNTEECQVVSNGNWGEWTYWSDCSVTCANGVHKRTRKCDNPPRLGSGKDCEGEAVETKPCNTGRKCPLDGKWAEWSEWESCDKCCGGGSQRRYRTCDNPPPGPNGKKCQGERIDSRKCNTHSCPDPKNCFFKYTQYTPLDKDGKPIFLDQHQIKCPTSHVLNYIRLQKNEQETMISYGYRCCKTQACANLPKTNDETYNGGGYGKVFNLDHQTVACKNEGLSSLKLDRDMTRWNYKYDCCKLGNQKAELDCYNANSQFLSDMGGSVLSLLNQEISCKCDDYYITDFKMNRNYNGNEDQIRYDFQCCKIKN
uniref:Hemicentin-1 n=1 Tax=Clytia hemisphaerica TaxID=252671 RepID=A0A7M5WTV5_9CNID